MTQDTDREVKGTRVFPKINGFLDGAEINSPASFGRATAPIVVGKAVGWWQITAPNGDACMLDPAVHTVTEHEDGTITVCPSIVMPRGWHGFLIKGVFRSC